MKVLNLVFDPRVGGPQRRIVSVARGLRSRGIETTLVVPPGEGGASSFSETNGTPAAIVEFSRPTGRRSVLGLLGYALSMPRDTLRFTRLFRSSDADVIHVNGALFVAPAVAARLTRRPLVWHLNDTIFPPVPSKVLGLVVRTLASEIVSAAGAVAEHYGVASRSTTISAPVDVHQFPARAQSDTTQLTPRIGLVGNWSWIKGHGHFVQIVAELQNSGIDVQATILGAVLDNQADYHREVLASATKLGVADRIEELGFVDEPAAAYADFDILVLTSESEASPTVVLEAMSIGVPVVCFDVGGVREMLDADTDDPAGIVVDRHDVSGAAKSIAELLEDAARYRSLSQAGQRISRERYSLEACTNKHALIYEAALARSRT